MAGGGGVRAASKMDAARVDPISSLLPFRATLNPDRLRHSHRRPGYPTLPPIPVHTTLYSEGIVRYINTLDV